jgi:hypothetical protein
VSDVTARNGWVARVTVGASARRTLVTAIALGVLLGTIAGWDTWRRLHAHPELNALDFTYPWRAAGHLIEGRDPYQHMTRAPYTQGGPFLYPLPAAILTLPLARLSVAAAGAVFMGVSVAVLGFALVLAGRWRLTLLVSAPFFFAIWNVQWSPLLVAGALLPAVGWAGAAKPNLGLVAFLHTPRWSTVAGIVVLGAFSIAVVPSWPAEWVDHVRRQPSLHTSALVWPFGAVGLVGLLRWRTPEGRTLAAMTLVPTSAWFYDQLFLWLVARTWKESVLLSACSWIAYLIVLAQAPIDLTVQGGARGVQTTLALGLYVPAAIIVARRRNEGRLPPIVERWAGRLPGWIRGSSASPADPGPETVERP